MKYFITVGIVLLPNKYIVNHINISALGEEIHYGKSNNLYSHSKIIVISSQFSIIQATGQCAEVKEFSYEVLLLDNLPIIDAIISYDFPY